MEHTPVFVAFSGQKCREFEGEVANAEDRFRNAGAQGKTTRASLILGRAVQEGRARTGIADLAAPPFAGMGDRTRATTST